jgi:hypothetical protein
VSEKPFSGIRLEFIVLINDGGCVHVRREFPAAFTWMVW